MPESRSISPRFPSMPRSRWKTHPTTGIETNSAAGNLQQSSDRCHLEVERFRDAGKANQTIRNHEHERNDEGVGGTGKQRPGFAHAAQGRNRDESNEEDAERYPMIVQPSQPSAYKSRRDRRHPGSNRNRNRENIVNQERSGGDQP